MAVCAWRETKLQTAIISCCYAQLVAKSISMAKRNKSPSTLPARSLLEFKEFPWKARMKDVGLRAITDPAAWPCGACD